MYHGDFRPLAAAIREGGAIDDAILATLAQFIDFADVAERLGMSEESVRAAVTAWNKARDKQVATDAAKSTSG